MKDSLVSSLANDARSYRLVSLAGTVTPLTAMTYVATSFVGRVRVLQLFVSPHRLSFAPEKYRSGGATTVTTPVPSIQLTTWSAVPPSPVYVPAGSAAPPIITDVLTEHPPVIAKIDVVSLSSQRNRSAGSGSGVVVTNESFAPATISISERLVNFVVSKNSIVPRLTESFPAVL